MSFLRGRKQRSWQKQKPVLWPLPAVNFLALNFPALVCREWTCSDHLQSSRHCPPGTSPILPPPHGISTLSSHFGEMASSLPWGLLVAVPENQSLIILVHFPEAFKTEIEIQVLAGERKGATGWKGSLEKATSGICPVGEDWRCDLAHIPWAFAHSCSPLAGSTLATRGGPDAPGDR